MQLIDKGYEKKKIACLLGEVTIRRVRYRCTGCQKDYYQLDSILELSSSKASKRLGKSITQIAAFIPFKETKVLSEELSSIMYISVRHGPILSGILLITDPRRGPGQGARCFGPSRSRYPRPSP